MQQRRATPPPHLHQTQPQPGPHDAHRQDSYLPMRYDTGRPRAVIRFKISTVGGLTVSTYSPSCTHRCTGRADHLDF